jgi:hypothetical protein
VILLAVAWLRDRWLRLFEFDTSAELERVEAIRGGVAVKAWRLAMIPVLAVATLTVGQPAGAQDGSYYGPRRFGCDFTDGQWITNVGDHDFCLHNWLTPRWVRRQCVRWVRIAYPTVTYRRARIACGLPVWPL